MIRLLLDAHYSYRHIGRVLEAEGVDVRSAASDVGLKRLSADALLAIAIAERRIMVTADTADFNKILIGLADASIDHAGVILVPKSIRNDAYGVTLALVAARIGRYDAGRLDQPSDLATVHYRVIK